MRSILGVDWMPAYLRRRRAETVTTAAPAAPAGVSAYAASLGARAPEPARGPMPDAVAPRPVSRAQMATLAAVALVEIALAVVLVRSAWGVGHDHGAHTHTLVGGVTAALLTTIGLAGVVAVAIVGLRLPRTSIRRAGLVLAVVALVTALPFSHLQAMVQLELLVVALPLALIAPSRLTSDDQATGSVVGPASATALFALVFIAWHSPLQTLAQGSLAAVARPVTLGAVGIMLLAVLARPVGRRVRLLALLAATEVSGLLGIVMVVEGQYVAGLVMLGVDVAVWAPILWALRPHPARVTAPLVGVS